MKKLILSAALTPLLVFTSCDELSQKLAINFDVPYSSDATVDELPGNPTIPSTGMKLTLFTTDQETKSQEYIKQYNTSSELLQEAKIKDLHLEMKAPSGQNFDMVDSLWVYLSATNKAEVLAAHKFAIPRNTTKIDFNLEDLNMKEYFLQERIQLRVEGHFYNGVAAGTVLNISGTISAKADPLEAK